MNHANPIPEKVLLVRDVGALLKIPPTTVYRMVKKYGLPAHRVGKHLRFFYSEIMDWVKNSPGGSR